MYKRQIFTCAYPSNAVIEIYNGMGSTFDIQDEASFSVDEGLYLERGCSGCGAHFIIETYYGSSDVGEVNLDVYTWGPEDVELVAYSDLAGNDQVDYVLVSGGSERVNVSLFAAEDGIVRIDVIGGDNEEYIDNICIYPL